MALTSKDILLPYIENHISEIEPKRNVFLASCKNTGISAQVNAYLSVEKIDTLKYWCDDVQFRSGRQESYRFFSTGIAKLHHDLFSHTQQFAYNKHCLCNDRDSALRNAFKLTEPSNAYFHNVVIVLAAIQSLANSSNLAIYCNSSADYHLVRNLQMLKSYCYSMCAIWATITKPCGLSNVPNDYRTFDPTFCVTFE